MVKKVITCMIFICTVQLIAQKKAEFGKIRLTKVTGEQRKSAPQSVLYSKLNTTSGIELRTVKTDTDKLKNAHTTYQQYYRGIKVELGKIKVHQKNGNITSYNGAFYDMESVNTSPKISKRNAIAIAAQYFNNTNVFWLAEDGISKENTPSVELVILPNRRESVLNLAYKIGVGTSKPELKMGSLYIDATNGTVLKFKNQVFSCFHEDHENHEAHTTHTTANNYVERAPNTTDLATGNATTVYSSSQSIETYLDGSAYILYDETRANTGSGHLAGSTAKYGIATVNFNHTDALEDYSNGDVVTEFEDNDNTWTATEMSSDEDQYALDAHWGATLVYDYWNNEHGRESYDGANSALVSYVHFDTNHTNAAWISFTNNRGFMVYGDGALSFTPLTNLDVVAHEIGHGVQNNTSDLDYELESGALNEGLSDIWAMVIDDYANNNYGQSKNSSLINDENGGGTIRSMSNPNAYLQPDTYGGTYWYDVENCTPNGTTNDYCGVHTNSGVLNYMFYVLVNGGSGTNDIGDSFSVTGIGMDYAAAIMYRMQSVYLTSTSDFEDARTGAIQSAIDLFGECSSAEEAVTNAFYAVGVGAAFERTYAVVTTDPTDVTAEVDENAEFTIEGTDFSSVTWSVNDGNGWNTVENNEVYSGATTTTLTLTGVDTSYNGFQFRANVESICGETDESEIATLSVIAYTAIPDANFEAALSAYDDEAGDGRVPTNNINTITRLDVRGKNISDLTGIEDFTALEQLIVFSNNLTTLDLSNNTALVSLSASDNNLTSVNLGTNTDYAWLLLHDNNISSIDVTDFSTLQFFTMNNNPITSLDLSTNSGLQYFYATGCNLTSLNLQNGNNGNISQIQLTDNPLLFCVLVDDAADSTTNWTQIDEQTTFSDTTIGSILKI